MKSIPRDFIEEVITRTDLIALISAVVPLKRNGKNFSACCPFHDEKTPSFTVSPDKQFYYCFGCGTNGNAIRFLMEHQHLGFAESVEMLAQRAGLPLPENTHDDTNARQQRQKLTHFLSDAAHFFSQQLLSPAGAGARNYLEQRGLSPKTWKHFGLGWAPNQWQHFLKTHSHEQHAALEAAGLIIAHEKRGYYERFRGRLMFPIRDHRGKVIGFGARVLDDTKPKYLNSPETAVFHKQLSLFGLYEWTHSKPKPTAAVLVEGYTDVIALHQAGLTQAVATLGTACSEHHLSALFQRTSTLYFCFDGDTAGHKAALRAAETALPLIRDGRQVFFLRMPEGEDPDSLVKHKGPGGFIALMESAQSLSEFLLTHLTQHHHLDNVDDRAALIAEAKPFFAKMPDSLYRSLLFDALAERTHINPTVLSAALLTQHNTPTEATHQHSPEWSPSPFAKSHHTTSQTHQTNRITSQSSHTEWHSNQHSNQHPAPTPNDTERYQWPLNPGEAATAYGKSSPAFSGSKGSKTSNKYSSWKNKKSEWSGKKTPSWKKNTWKDTLPPLPTESLSLIDTITSLVIQNPRLAHGIKLSERIRSAALPQVELLDQILQEIHHEPDCSLAYLLGHWHNTPASHYIARLATRHTIVDNEAALKTELDDALRSLEMTALEHHIDQALNCPSPDPNTLKALLSEKSQLSAAITSAREQSETT